VRKSILAAALVLGVALPAAASDQPNKPSSSQTTTGAGLNPNMIQTPFRFIASGNYVFVINGGTADWTGPLDVTITCTPVAPTKSCSNTPVHKHYNKGEFPKGHGQTPASAPSGNSVIITQGGGYDAIFMGEAVGTYQFVAKAANNTSPQMSVNVTTPPPGSPTPVVVSPAVTLGVSPKRN
jgi:hypothetical protein